MKHYELVSIKYYFDAYKFNVRVSHPARLVEILNRIKQQWPKLKIKHEEYTGIGYIADVDKEGDPQLPFKLFTELCDAGWQPLDFETLRLEIEE